MQTIITRALSRSLLARTAISGLAIMVCFAAGPVFAADPTGAVTDQAALEAVAAAEAQVPVNPLRDAFFGETHLHTAYSLDAYLGGTRITPDDAYRYGRGEEMMVNGEKHKITEPLDFVAVTDHAEYLGEMYSTLVEGAPGHDQDLLKELRGLKGYEEREKWFLEYVIKSNISQASLRGISDRH